MVDSKVSRNASGDIQFDRGVIKGGGRGRDFRAQIAWQGGLIGLVSELPRQAKNTWR